MRVTVQSAGVRLRPTGEQQMILDAFSTGDDLAIEAFAGSGKTASLLLCAESTGKRGVYLAFNRALKEEAQRKFPDTVKVATTHGYAFGVLGRRYAHRLNAARMPWVDCARTLKIRKAVTFREGTILLKPGTLARMTAEMVNNFCYSKAEEITLGHMPYDEVFLDEERVQLAKLLLPYAQVYWEDVQQPRGVLRFGHDHYLKMWQLQSPVVAGDYLLIDEFQDTNPCVYDVVDHQTHLQRVAVGDPYQALYAWRGAVDALSDFKVPHRLPLTMSFRFGAAVAEVANKFLAMLGSEHELSGNPKRDSVIYPGLDDAGAVLTRTNAGAVEALMTAQKLGYLASLVGGATDVKAFLAAAQALKAGRETWHPELSLFQSWQAVQEHVEDDPNSEFSMLVGLIQQHGEELGAALEATVDEADADVIISTTHKAKGREFPSVRLSRDLQVQVMLDLYDAAPNRAGDNAADQRLRYVAVTRAEKALDPGPAEPTPRLAKAWEEAGL